MDDGLRAARIAAVFGVLFVEVNVGRLRPEAVAVAVRVVAGIAFVAIFVRLLRRRATVASGDGADRFGAAYWSLVVLETAALALGLLVLSGNIPVGGSLVHDLRRHESLSDAAWVTLVVGLHFLGLLAVWGRPTLGLVGMLLTVFAVAALAFARYGAEASSALFAGVLPGAVLLTTSASRARRGNA